MSTLNRKGFRDLKTLVVFILIVVISGLLASSQILGSSNSNEARDDSTSVSPSTLDHPTYVGLLDQTIDYSDPKNLAISLSFPLFQHGAKAYPTSFTGGGSIDQALASEQYYKAKARARRIAISSGNQAPPNSERNFADCGAFVSTVVINTIDPDYPGLLVYKQRAYVSDPTNGWVRIGSSNDLGRMELSVGDVFITNTEDRTGHTWIWLGEVSGESDIIADASYGTDESQTAHLPALRKNPVLGKTKDARGRSYDVWRFIGK